MTPYPETSDSLIDRIKSTGHRDDWEKFVSIYRPVIYRTAVAKGLQEADAQDLSQQVLLAVASAIPRWEKQNESTRFRHWLRRITRNAILNALTRCSPVEATGGSSSFKVLLEQPIADADTESLIDWEYRRELFLRAKDIVSRSVQVDTWRAFELTAIDGLTNQEASVTLGKSLGSIYTARCRVMQRLQAAVAELESCES